MTTDVQCSRCGRMMVLRYDPDCPIEWLEKLAAIAVCDKCHDSRKVKPIQTEIRQQTNDP